MQSPFPSMAGMGYQVFQRQKGWIFGDSVDQNIKITVIIHEILAKAN